MLAHRPSGRRHAAALALVGALPLVACNETPRDQLFISSTTIVGIDASVDTTRQSGRVQIGYDRYFLTWIPQVVRQEDNGIEVMSALNCTKMEVGSLALRKFDESLATGVAAQKFSPRLAESGPGSRYFDCFSN